MGYNDAKIENDTITIEPASFGGEHYGPRYKYTVSSSNYYCSFTKVVDSGVGIKFKTYIERISLREIGPMLKGCQAKKCPEKECK